MEAGTGDRAAVPGNQLVYVGTYTGAHSRGIHAVPFGPDGQLGVACLVAEAENPSFLALHPTRPLLYAVNEIAGFQGRSSGAISAFAVDVDTGGLRLLNQVPSGGADPCHLVVDGSGRHVLVANYTGGSVASLRIRDDGGLEPNVVVPHAGASIHPERQRGPYAHAVALDASNRIALVADLGLDQVLLYDFDAQEGTLAARDPAFARLRAGAGPRHLAFAPDERQLFVINELDLTVTAFVYERGRLRPGRTASTLPPRHARRAGDLAAELQVHPRGHVLYASNRGPDTIAVLAIHADGALEPVQHVPSGGRTPRHFTLDPGGRFLLAANQESDGIAVFRVHPESGLLAPTPHRVAVGSPVCLLFADSSSRPPAAPRAE